MKTMKRAIPVIFALAAAFNLSAQNTDDALRYSQLFYNGTARFMSMGGAFTALGADLSSLSQNPGGIGVFRSSEVSVTPQLNYVKSTSSYNGTLSTSYLDNFNLGQAGFVSTVSLGKKESGLVSFNFGYSFNKTNNLNRSTLIDGVNQKSSMADYWAANCEGTFYKNLSGAEGIVYDAWVIDTITGTGAKSFGTVFSNYGDNYPSVYGQKLRRLISYEGFTGEHAISIGGNYSDKLYFGATFGISQVDYVNHYEHLESTDKIIPSGFKNFNYVDRYEHTGIGFGLKVGAIYRPVEALRIGLAIHTPTWYTINEYFWQSITSKFAGNESYDYSTDPLRYEFALATPYRILAGVAFQVKKFAILSADYEYVNYASAKFSETGDGYNYTEKNDILRTSLNSASNLRLGGELRLGKAYLRSGYGYYGKPYKSTEDNGSLDYRTISGGIGFREKNISIDLGYTNLKYQEVYFLYPFDSSIDVADANLSTIKNILSLTAGFKF